jgi:hypothetical protein
MPHGRQGRLDTPLLIGIAAAVQTVLGEEIGHDRSGLRLRVHQNHFEGGIRVIRLRLGRHLETDPEYDKEVEKQRNDQCASHAHLQCMKERAALDACEPELEIREPRFDTRERRLPPRMASAARTAR